MPDALRERQFVDVLLSSLGLEPDEIDDGREKPDVRIRLADRRIGIEVTEATPEEYVRGLRTLRKSNETGWISTANWQHRPNRRTTRELLAEADDPNRAWVDHAESFERWKNRIIERLSDKERAFSRPEFDKLDENWLLIADETRPISSELDVVEAAWFFRDLAQKFKPVSYFDLTFIDLGQSLFVKWDHQTPRIDFILPDGQVIRIA